METKFNPGDEVTFDIPNYGCGKGNIAGYFVHNDGTKLYAIYPKNPRINSNYNYVCVITEEKNLVPTPF
jgi:hypothetical protein